LQAALEHARNFEDVLNVCRRWANDRKLQAGVQALRGLIDWGHAGAALSDIASVAIALLQNAVIEEFARSHGRIERGEWVAIAMGQLGESGITPSSGVEPISVYDHVEGAQPAEGRDWLVPRRYFARLAQRTIIAITAPTVEGKLYEVDM